MGSGTCLQPGSGLGHHLSFNLQAGEPGGRRHQVHPARLGQALELWGEVQTLELCPQGTGQEGSLDPERGGLGNLLWGPLALAGFLSVLAPGLCSESHLCVPPSSMSSHCSDSRCSQRASQKPGLSQECRRVSGSLGDVCGELPPWDTPSHRSSLAPEGDPQWADQWDHCHWVPGPH